MSEPTSLKEEEVLRARDAILSLLGEPDVSAGHLISACLSAVYAVMVRTREVQSCDGTIAEWAFARECIAAKLRELADIIEAHGQTLQ